MWKRTVSGIMLALLIPSMLYTTLNVRLVAAWSNGGYSDNPSNPLYGTLREASDSWVWVRKTVTGSYGEAVVGTGKALYIARGASFYGYLPADKSWVELTSPPNPGGTAFKVGTALAWDFGDHIYALYGAATDESRRWFYRYSISSNSWEALANTTADQGEGDAITWVGIDNCIYATIGGEQRPTYFMRYDPSTNSWSDIPTDPPAGMGDGASLVWTGGNYLYALRGEFLEDSPLYDFWRYSLTENVWTAMADIPAEPHSGGSGGVGDGGSLLYIGQWLPEHADYIYALSGNQAHPDGIPDNRTYRYTISTNSWERLADMPFGVGYYVGCRLGYADGHIYAWQGAPSTWTGGGDALARYEWIYTRVLYVSPILEEYWTPAYGTIFTVDIKIANVYELYGFEFKIYWSTTLLDLINVNITPPSVWGTNYFIGMNETREDSGRYWLAVAALNPAPSFSGSTTLAKLTFKTTYDPIYPRNVTSKLDLADTNLSDPEANPIPHDAYDGEYRCYSTKVKLKAEPPTYKAKTLGETFTVNVTVADIVNLYRFEFKLSYNTTLLDAIGVNIGSFLNPPYRIHASIDDVAGAIWFSVESQAPATSTNGSGILATITLQVTQKCGIWCKGYVPPECDLHIYGTVLKTKEAVTIPHDTTNPFVHFVYMPIPGDLNSDGIVNVLDVAVVARVFGSRSGDPNWDPRADLNRDSKINIYDLVLVSVNYGRTEP